MKKRRASYDPSYVRYLEKHPEAAKNEPTGHITTYGSPDNNSTKWYAEKQYPGSERDKLMVSDNELRFGNNQPTPNFPTGGYPKNPNLDYNLGEERGPYTQPKLQAQGDPKVTYGVRQDDSMDRTIVGDKRVYNDNPQVWREGGRDMIQNSQDHSELIDQALGAHGFIRNEMANFGGTKRYEHKLSGDYAEVVPSSNGQKINFFDRSQRLLGSSDTFSGMDGLLGERYREQGKAIA